MQIVVYSIGRDIMASLLKPRNVIRTILTGKRVYTLQGVTTFLLLQHAMRMYHTNPRAAVDSVQRELGTQSKILRGLVNSGGGHFFCLNALLCTRTS